ncbi:ATP-dependent DNA helicase PIF1 [Corchorus olitorius]|uniref:ATP-dependent DNA helicase PIF1 n=1 Tax=Corchorus olitorius TaxID=93759 RepID=A0A1R3ITQ0_9ROSI|nr:ATP-dependent DNA helicase PIF1 [Corchorus olitorius]
MDRKQGYGDRQNLSQKGAYPSQMTFYDGHCDVYRPSYLLQSQMLKYDRLSQIIVNCDRLHGVGDGVHPVAVGQARGQSLTLIRRLGLS